MDGGGQRLLPAVTFSHLAEQLMTKTGLQGPYPLSFDAIDAVVTRTSAGVYALGHSDAQGRFCINHVGRSDSDLRSRLLDYIGSDRLFKYGYSASSQTAFEKECQLFHDFSPPGNRLHPDRPKGTTWSCPRCRMFARVA
jgi:hypothetical protein